MKKVLFMTYDFPYPFNSGGKIRAANLLKYSQRGCAISLFSFTRGEVSSRQLKKLQEMNIKNIQLFPRPAHTVVSKIKSTISMKGSIFNMLYYSRAVEDALVREIEKNDIDILHCESFYTSYYINPRIISTGVKTVFGTENIEYKLYDAYVRSSVMPLLRPIYQREVQKIKKEEHTAAALADQCIAVSAEEAAHFTSESGKECVVIENGIDPEYFVYKKRKKKNICTVLFVGNFRYFPNVEAVEYLYNNIYKKLNAQKFSLMIVGKDAQKLAIPLHRNITVHEYIEDIRDAYQEADVFVFPTQLGGGTNFKLLEAMACGVPVVGLPDRLTALGVTAGKHFFQAKDPEEFIDTIQQIAKGAVDVNIVTKHARTFVEKNYAWSIIGEKMNKVWKRL